MKHSQNLVNPCEYIGDLHNQGLDFLGKNLLSFEKVPFKNEILVNMAVDFISNSNYFGNISTSNLQIAGSYGLNYYFLETYPNDFTQEQKIYAEKVLSIFDNIKFPFDQIESLNKQIEIQVAEVLKSSLTEEEQIPILSSLAVAKNSLYYWDEQYINKNSYWSKIKDLQSNQNNNLRLDWPDIDWGKVIKADIKGALGGFIKSLFFGGGAIAGGVTGAISSSAAELIVQIYDYYN
ncbi:MAG: hypothetical protein EAZ75_09780 [Flavobacteriia bacterium]|nr:MAG: hypothetical protein EAZ75_09780 [Flavobacteriia bacterium]